MRPAPPDLISAAEHAINAIARKRGVRAHWLWTLRKFPDIVQARHEVWRDLHAQGWSCRQIGHAWNTRHQPVALAVSKARA